MMLLQSLFISVINLSIGAGFLILALIFLRPLLKRLPKWLVCAMWALVAIRLVLPFRVESSLSLMPAWGISLPSEKTAQIPMREEAGTFYGNEEEKAAGDNAASQTGVMNGDGEEHAGTGLNQEAGGLAGSGSILGADGTAGSGSINGTGGAAGTDQNLGSDDYGGAGKATDMYGSENSNALFNGKVAGDEAGSMAQGRDSQPVLSGDKMDRVLEGMQKVQKSETGKGAGSLKVGEEMLRKNFTNIMLFLCSGLWLAGILVMLGYGLFSCLRLRRTVKAAKRSEIFSRVGDLLGSIHQEAFFSGNFSLGNRFAISFQNTEIWSGSGIEKPFVMGFFHPRIYLPKNLRGQDLYCVLQHEFAHIKRGDYLWKPFGFLILCVYWFHPLCWVSYFLFCRDVEMACDEKATKEFDPGQRARYCQTILDLSSGKRDSLIGSVAFGQSGTKARVEAVLKYKKPSFVVIAIGVLACLFLGIFFLTSPNGKAIGNLLSYSANDQETGTEGAFNSSDEPVASLEQSQMNQQDLGNDTGEALQETDIRLSGKAAWESEGIYISNFYTRDDGDIQNAYVIDEDGVLWGYGENGYGQLGQGFADQDFYTERVKIAEHVIHVDYSETGFVIYLTEDHVLYGLGNGGFGTLLTGGNVDWNSIVHVVKQEVCAPVFLMDHVQYACCGRNDVVCLLEDGSVWTWGITGISTARAYNYVPEPVKIMDGAILVTGGLFNHAALLEDGSVWTWGYNYAGGCGVAEFGIVDTPTKVAENVIKVWTSRKRTNTCADYENMSLENEKQVETTIIEKADYSFFRCGEGVGSEEKILKKYYEAVDFPMICTHEFLPCTPRNFDGTEATAEEAFKRFLSGDRTVLDPEQKRQGYFAGYLFGLDYGFPYEYVMMDLDGDGTEELIVQGGDDLGDYNGVFHYESETGRVISWRDDAFESDRVYPLSDGIMAKRWCDYTLAREFWIIFRYLSDGEEKEIKRLVCGDPSADIVEAGLEERNYPWYEIDGVEITKEEFQKEYEESIYNKRVTSWRNAATGETREFGEGTGISTWCYGIVHFEQKWLTKLEDFDRNGDEEYLTVEARPISYGSGSILTVYWNKKAIYQYEDVLNIIEVRNYQYVDLDDDGEKELFLELLPNVNVAGMVQYLVLKEGQDGWHALENYETIGESLTNSFPLKITYSDKPWEARITCDGYDGEILVDIKRVYDAWDEGMGEIYGYEYQKAFGKGNQSGECAQIAPWGIWEIGFRHFEGKLCLVARQGIIRDYKNALWGVVDIIFDYDKTGKIHVRDMRFEYVDEYYGSLNLPSDLKAVMSDVKLVPGTYAEENGEGLLPTYYYVKIDQPSSYSFRFRVCAHNLLTDEDRAVTEWQRAYFYNNGSLAISKFDGHVLYFQFLLEQTDSIPEKMTVDGLGDFGLPINNGVFVRD